MPSKLGGVFLPRARIGRRSKSARAGAAETLKNLQGPFDLCFIDADKPSYDYYYDRCVELIRKGGLIVLDNMLRYGRVLNPTEEDARIVNLLNDRIQKDPRSKTSCCRFATASCWPTNSSQS